MEIQNISQTIEVGNSSQIHISPASLEYFSRTSYECRSGIIPSDPPCILSNESIIDPSRVPSPSSGMNRQLIKILIPSVPYDIKKFGTNYKDQ